MAKIEIEGMNSLKRKLTDYAANASRKVTSALYKGALMIEGDAKPMAPVDSGTLRGSISHEVKPEEGIAIVGTTVDYAPWQEFGTRKIPPHPYLRPAYEKNKEPVKRLIAEAYKYEG